MKTEKINLANVCSIRIYIREICKSYEYREASWWNREGFYRYGMDYVNIQEIIDRKDCFITDKTVFYKPHIDFLLSDGELVTKWFETEQELNSFLENNEDIKKLKLITI